MLFLLAALLPLGGLAVYAYYQVSDLLVDIGHRRLQQDSKALGMSIVEELNWRARVLQREAAHDADPGHLLKLMPEGFSGLAALDDRTVLSASQLHHLAQGKVVFRLLPDGRGDLLVRHEASGRVIAGRLDMQAIWNNDEVPERYCIFDTAYRPLYCAQDVQPPPMGVWTGSVPGKDVGIFTWRIGETHFLGSGWRVRLLPGYAHPGLIVMVAEPSEILLDGIAQFRVAFIAIAILAFGLALLLASSQIRRSMQPLERLLDGTRALASGDFAARVPVSGEDEFGSLARSFNHMSGTLQSKFHMLQMLAELDRFILGSTEMDSIVKSVMRRIRKVIPCDGAGIVRFDAQGGGRLFPADAPETGLECRDVACLLPKENEETWYRRVWDALSDSCLACLAPIAPQGCTQALVFPVRVHPHIDSLLVLTYVRPVEDSGEIAEVCQTLTDRLAVAASNIAWEEKLYHQAHYDALTDLPNRTLLRDCVEQAMVRADRAGSSVAVMLIDLDGFKQVNDSLGHSAGDALLIEYARRLKSITRQSDTTARLGGDEFVLLLSDLPRGGEAVLLDALAHTLNRVLAEPTKIDERSITSQASIGIALYPDNAANFEDLLKMADAAMYASKRHQPGSHGFYSSQLNVEAKARFEMIQDLREAISRNELLLYYQPKVCIATGEIKGAEALIRWNSSKHGLLSAGRFVAYLGEMGLESWLGEWVLMQACAQMAEWDSQGLPALPVSVNISPQSFSEAGLLEKIMDMLEHYRLAPRRLELEILETTAANTSPAIHATLRALREAGIGIALDDFGTGYSSLVYLTQLPVNVLKLDRAFICKLVDDTRQQSIVERIIALARTLDFQVVAEGVEDEAQRAILAGMGCDLMQGYLISQAVPPEAFVALVRANRQRAAMLKAV